MKSPVGSLVRFEPQRLGWAAFVGCLVAPLVILAVLRPYSRTTSILNVQLSIVNNNNEPALLIGETSSSSSSLSSSGEAAPLITGDRTNNSPRISIADEEEDKRNSSRSHGQQLLAAGEGNEKNTWTLLESADKNSSQRFSIGDEAPTLLAEIVPNSSSSDERLGNEGELTTLVGTSVHRSDHEQYPGAKIQETSKLVCDTSQIRTDLCEMYGDVRITGTTTSTAILVTTSTSLPEPTSNATNTTKIRPYARKWESPLMVYIKQITVGTSPRTSKRTPTCHVNHTVPAIVFSTGGFQGNFFHEMTDVLIPLFLTSYNYKGQVQLLINDYKPWWVQKYQKILTQLSHYQPIDLDSDGNVHCFPEATIGLRSHTELGIDSSKPPRGLSMIEFRKFLRNGYSLKREFSRGGQLKRKPRLILMSRRRSRSMTNEREVARMARGLGYKVIVAGPELTRNLSRTAEVVNGCDVMMGVHGAGLTNMMFLPVNATVIQVIPWGELKYACRFAFGDPAVGMGVRYLEYEIGMDESSLIRKYPRDHAVFTDPLSIHRKGFGAMWSIFIDQQNVTIDVDRFRSVLLEAMPRPV